MVLEFFLLLSLSFVTLVVSREEQKQMRSCRKHTRIKRVRAHTCTLSTHAFYTCALAHCGVRSAVLPVSASYTNTCVRAACDLCGDDCCESRVLVRRNYPYLITAVHVLMDEQKVVQGSAGYANDHAAPGDTLISVASTPVLGFNSDDLCMSS